jgi:hypothetical protein
VRSRRDGLEQLAHGDLELGSLRLVERAQRRAHGARDRHPAHGAHRLEGIGNRSSVARAAAARAVASGVRSRTAPQTSSGNADASAEITPIAPPARPRAISASGPTKMSSPSIRYGSKRSHGASDTLRPARFGTRSPRRSITDSGIGYPLRAVKA